MLQSNSNLEFFHHPIPYEGSKVVPQTIPISEIPLVSSMSGKMNILRAYTQQKNRNKVEIAAKSILGEL